MFQKMIIKNKVIGKNIRLKFNTLNNYKLDTINRRQFPLKVRKLGKRLQIMAKIMATDNVKN